MKGEIFPVFFPHEESQEVRDIVHRMASATLDVVDHSAGAKACWLLLAAHIATIPDDDFRNDFVIKFFVEHLRDMVEAGRAKVRHEEAIAGKSLQEIADEPHTTEH
jgi:hypothetical protein